MIVASDSSPIIALAAVDQLSLLRDLFRHVLVPERVFREIMAAEDGSPGVREVRATDWIEKRSVKNQELVQALSLELDVGEAEAIALAKEVQADLLLMDERRGRKVAERFGHTALGVLGVLILAKVRGEVEAVQPILESLQYKAGFYVSRALYERVLREAGEAG